MLNLFRKNTKSIIWSVIIVFILCGGLSVGSLFKDSQSKDSRYAGQVFGENISAQEFDSFYRSTQLFNFSEKDAKDPEILQESAWQGVIFSHEAKRLKINVTDAEVREQVLKILDQQKMSVDSYPSWLERGLRLTPQQFEEMVRELLRIRKLLARFEPSEASLKITPEEAEKNYLEENDKIAVEFVRFPEKKKAEEFRGKLKTPEDWKKEKEKSPAPFASTGGLVRLSSLSAFLQLTPADNVSVQLLEKNSFSGVLTTGKDFSVLYVTDRTRGDAKEFEAKKTAYMDTLKERKRQNLIMGQTQEILTRARLTDNLKKPAKPPL